MNVSSLNSRIIHGDTSISVGQIGPGDYSYFKIPIAAPDGYEIMGMVFTANYSPHLSISWTEQADDPGNAWIVIKNNYSSALTPEEISVRKWFYKS